jgi:hypothetical protein
MTDIHQSEEPPDMIRVLTFNLLSPGQADWEPRRAVAQPVLRELRPMWWLSRKRSGAAGTTRPAIFLGPTTRWCGTRAAPPTGSAPYWQAGGRSAASAKLICT